MNDQERKDWFLRNFEEWRDEMIEKAIYFRENHSRNYRDFRVGASMLGYVSGAGLFLIGSGANRMPWPRSDYLYAHEAYRRCAETMAFSGLQGQAANVPPYMPADTVVGLVVVGEAQEDTMSGMSHRTLHPCYECRTSLQAWDQTSPHAIFLGVTPDLQTQEQMTVAELIALHATNWTEAQRNLPS